MNIGEMGLLPEDLDPAKHREMRLEGKMEDFAHTVREGSDYTDEEMQDPKRVEMIRQAAERELRVEDLQASIKNIERRAKELLDSTPDMRLAIQQALEEEFGGK